MSSHELIEMSLTGRVVRSLCCVLALPVFAGCGSQFHVAAPALTGNWNIVGDSSFRHFPSVSFALIESGSDLYAQGIFLADCRNHPVGGGGSVELRGQAAPDGTFVLIQPVSNSIRIDGDPVQVIVHGMAPIGGAGGWSGTYSITTPAGSSGCLLGDSGSFTAVPFQPVSGTYSGTLREDNLGPGKPTVSVVVTQGDPVAQSVANGQTYWRLPLTGTISVSGIPCFTHGSTGLYLTSVAGSHIAMAFTMDDGSLLTLTGSLTDTSSASLNVIAFSAFGGQCSQAYSGTLTRQ